MRVCTAGAQAGWTAAASEAHHAEVAIVATIPG